MRISVFCLCFTLVMGCGVPVGTNQNSEFNKEEIKSYFANTFNTEIKPSAFAVSAKPAVVRLGEIPFTIRKTDITLSLESVGSVEDVYVLYESFDTYENNISVYTNLPSGNMVVDSPKPGLYGFWVRSLAGIYAVIIIYPAEIEQFVSAFSNHQMLASTTFSLWKFYKRVAFADIQTLPVFYGMDAGIGSIAGIRLLPRVHTVYISGNNMLEDFSALFEPRIQPIVKLYLGWNTHITMRDIPVWAHINTLDIRGLFIPDDYVWMETSFPSLGQFLVSSGQLPEVARKKFERRRNNPVHVLEGG